MCAGTDAPLSPADLERERLVQIPTAGVAESVLATEGPCLGYVSLDRVRADKLAAVRMVNAAGRPLAASEATIRAAIRESDLHKTGGPSCAATG